MLRRIIVHNLGRMVVFNVNLNPSARERKVRKNEEDPAAGLLLPGPFRSLAGIVVVADVAEQQAVFGAVHVEADVAVDANGPEAAVPGFIELMEL